MWILNDIDFGHPLDSGIVRTLVRPTNRTRTLPESVSMEDKLQQLTDKIYQEGIARAQSEQNEIIEAARHEADNIRAEAQKEASQTVRQAEKEAADMKDRAHAELVMLSRNTLATLRQDLRDMLRRKVLDEPVQAVLTDPKTMAGLLEKVVAQIGRDDQGKWVIQVGGQTGEEVRASMRQALSSILDQEPQLESDSGMFRGFEIRRESDAYAISFREEDLQAILAPFLGEELKSLLRDEA